MEPSSSLPTSKPESSLFWRIINFFKDEPEQTTSNNEEQKTLEALEKLTISSQNDYYQLINSTKDWEMVKQSLLSISQNDTITLDQAFELIQKFIKLYEPQQDMNIGTLKSFFKKQTQNENLEWEKKIFPQMFSLILKTSELFPDKIPLLVQGKAQKVTLTKQQCACLMSHMFICTTISQSQQHQKKLPASFNFAELYSSSFFSNDHIKLEKLKCIANYFKRIFTAAADCPDHKIVFERLVLNEIYSIDQWKNSQQKLLGLEIRPTGKIEDAAEEAIEVDFANKFLGGGVIKKGTAQEEIMFITSPETLVGVLFSEVMLDTEAILIQGTEIYCKYKGFLSNFTFDGDFQDKRAIRKDGVLDRDITAIDALNFRRYPDISQFSEGPILRELNKALIGFSGNLESKKKIATGKWGCGDFQGDNQLKFLIQWLASSMTGREMIFYSFQDVKDLKNAEELVTLFKGREVGVLASLVLSYCEQKSKNKDDLFTFLINCKSNDRNVSKL